MMHEALLSIANVIRLSLWLTDRYFLWVLAPDDIDDGSHHQQDEQDHYRFHLDTPNLSGSDCGASGDYLPNRAPAFHLSSHGALKTTLWPVNVAAFVEWIASGDTTETLQGAARGAVLLDREDHVLRATGLERARAPRVAGYQSLVRLDGPDHRSRGEPGVIR